MHVYKLFVLLFFYQLYKIAFTQYICYYINNILTINFQPLYNYYKFNNLYFFINQKLDD